MLYIIGLGLADEKDITVKGLEAVQKCERVYLEAYTSILLVDQARLEAFYGKKVILADRDMVEQQADEILKDAESVDVAFLVVGDPYGATTHSDLVLRAQNLGIAVKSIHNASVMNAIGACGLQLYNYGLTVSIPFFTDTWKPSSFYDKILGNMRWTQYASESQQVSSLHTLCLLDIKVKEQSIENLARGRNIYEPPRFMTVNQALQQLMEIEQERQCGVISGDTLVVGIARLGSESQVIRAGTVDQLIDFDFGPPLHCLILPGQLHEIERDALSHFMIDQTKQK
ncbi:hypothetical protein MP228_005981 [Amoeboaphelidium protococcarum]|nr:hypothetical protein MP228_005981 [Amoeboaphelidium protococcarum]